MKYIVTILLMFLSINVYGEELKKNYLSSELSVFSGLTIVTDYYSYLVKIFSEAYGQDDVNFRAVVTPSFSPEYVIGVRQKGDKHYAFKLSSEKHIWSEYQAERQQNALDSFLKNKFKIIEAEAEISKDTLKLIEKSLNRMLLEAKYQDPNGLDGITYHFSNSRLVTAKSWSPDPDSHSGYLVKLTELLGQLTETNDKGNIEKQIINIARVLAESLNKSPNQPLSR